MTVLPLLFLTISLFSGPSKFDGPRPGIDVLGYQFNLTLSDHVDVIEGKASVTVRFVDGPRDFYLDLVSRKPNDVGMSVASVAVKGAAVPYDHVSDRLWIRAESMALDSVTTFDVVYRGVPADGLIISRNMYGDRTFFADNWPNRARNWLPTVDHPADKALVDFLVTAPDHYQVISNGTLVEESDLPAGLRMSHWSSTQVLPTKIMVIGVARFAVQYLGDVDGVPLQTWVYPQSRREGFHDFAVATDVLRYLDHLVGPFPFSKLANVQSTTRYGGMENAGAIFYDEKAVRGTRSQEHTVAHEIAHQWFGDSASEIDWHDVWLSEGFATYLPHLYFEHYYGSDRLRERMITDRNTVISFAQANPRSPVVDTTITDPNKVLNDNSYEKGGWTLHMLRAMLGDETFIEVLKTYYQHFAFGNASTADFRGVAERVSGRDLGWFFDQWIYRPGVPNVSMGWQYDADRQTVEVSVGQDGPLYRLPLEIQIATVSDSRVERVEMVGARQKFRFTSPSEPTQVQLDPNVRLLADIGPK